MLLQFPNGDAFATGAMRYDYCPVSAVGTMNRLILPVEIEGILTEAIVDTGAPYVVCAPAIALLAGFDCAYAFERMRMLIRGMQLEGSLTHLIIKLLAREGDDLIVDATVFVPDVEEYWGNFPSFIRPPDESRGVCQFVVEQTRNQI